MVMFFYDEAGELEEYQTFRRQDQPKELEHLKMRVALKDAEAALQISPGDQELEGKVANLKEGLAALERQAPWINLDYPLEFLLWSPPHG
jgi:hypothetical protein